MISANVSNNGIDFIIGSTQINECDTQKENVAVATKRKADEMDDADVIKKFDTHGRKKNVSAMNRDSLLKELNLQSKKITNAENQRKRRESILREIEMKKKEVLHAKKEKLNVKRLLSNELQLLSSKNVDPEDPVYKEKMNKSAEQLNIYNQIMKDAQTVIKSKEAVLKGIDGIAFDPHDGKMDVSAMNKDSLLKELDTQSKKKLMQKT